MKLYTHPFSTNARRVTLTAAHLEIPLELAIVDLLQGENRRPEFLAVSPHGRVPVLVDGDLVLPESIAIMTYLADSVPGQTLYPTDRKARARVDAWLYWVASHLAVASHTLFFERVLKKMFGQGEPDPYTIERNETQFRHLTKVLDAELANRRFVAGDTLTLADFALVPSYVNAAAAQLPTQGRPNIDRWFAEIQALPAFQRTAT